MIEGKLWLLRSLSVFLAVFVASGIPVGASAGRQSSVTVTDEPFLEEWIYKVKWGHSEEFFEILKKYQLAILEREKQLGYVTQYTVYTPGLHTSEDQRWDYRVSIVFKNQAASKHEREVAHACTGTDPAANRDQARGRARAAARLAALPSQHARRTSAVMRASVASA